MWKKNRAAVAIDECAPRMDVQSDTARIAELTAQLRAATAREAVLGRRIEGLMTEVNDLKAELRQYPTLRTDALAQLHQEAQGAMAMANEPLRTPLRALWESVGAVIAAKQQTRGKLHR